jgi:hypothetical protein
MRSTVFCLVALPLAAGAFAQTPPRDAPARDTFAVDKLDPQWFEPEYLERIRSKATSVIVNEGETKLVDLKVTTAS